MQGDFREGGGQRNARLLTGGQACGRLGAGLRYSGQSLIEVELGSVAQGEAAANGVYRRLQTIDRVQIIAIVRAGSDPVVPETCLARSGESPCAA